ncbi:GNAT family N-acetyltransferase, partial [bacterium]|nr:GNAT family N-acetyltransferase [bacterium]
MAAVATVVREASLDDPVEARAVVDLVDGYASEAMHGGRPLPGDVRRALVPGLAAHPTALVLLAWRGDDPVGIAVCFRGFSTWSARPLLNLHDLAVVPSLRRTGIGRRLLAAVEERARALG